MPPTNVLLFTPQSATELMIQDAVIRRVRTGEHTLIELSCQRGLAVLPVTNEQLASAMHNLGLQRHELEGQKVLAYLDHTRVIGLGPR